MIFKSKNPSPIFLTKTKKKRLQRLQNEFTQKLSQEEAAILLDWIGNNIRNKMVSMEIKNEF